VPSNLLLLLPILGGYLFIHFCFRFYFRAQALDGNRLIFEAAVAGFVLFLPCRLLTSWLFHHAPGPREVWYGLAGRTPLLSALILTPLLALGAAYIWNLCESTRAWQRSRDEEAPDLRAFLDAGRERTLSWAVRRWGNSFQILLHEAAKRASREKQLVCLTMKDRKAFVGWVVKSPNLRANDSYVSLVPLMSGYREKDTLDLTFSVFYPVERYFGKDPELKAEDFVVALPVAEITSARLFDLKLYSEIFAAGTDEPAPSQRAEDPGASGPARANPS
jgi:hypothetical protein